MKRFLGFALAGLAIFFMSFKPAYSIDEVIGALKNGNASQMARYFDSRVDVSLPDKSDNYSKKQAEMVLRDFFNAHNVRGFQVKHSGETNGSQFCIGLLQTKNGNFRTKLYMKRKGDVQVVQEIAFQSEK